MEHTSDKQRLLLRFFPDLFLQMDVQIICFLKFLCKALPGHHKESKNEDDGYESPEAVLQVDIPDRDQSQLTEFIEHSEHNGEHPGNDEQHFLCDRLVRQPEEADQEAQIHDREKQDARNGCCEGTRMQNQYRESRRARIPDERNLSQFYGNKALQKLLLEKGRQKLE